MSYDPNASPYQSPSSSYLPPKPGPAGPDQIPLVLAIISVVCGMMGFFSCLCCLFLPLPVVSLATGVPVLCMRSDQTAKTIAIVGVVFAALSIVAIILGIVLGFAGAITDQHFQQQFNR